jgi:hypothetical protein
MFGMHVEAKRNGYSQHLKTTLEYTNIGMYVLFLQVKHGSLLCIHRNNLRFSRRILPNFVISAASFAEA